MSATGKKQPNPIDIHVGSRIRLRRTMNGMSQERLGDSLGITFQQIQKYERGTNRVGASRLQNIANVLNVPVAFFFEGAPENDANILDANALQRDHFQTFLSSPEGFRLNCEFVKIMDPKVRHRIIEMVRAIAAENGDRSARPVN
ncbi:transcriptional regulator with XRE-family HTH domain [Agrobacterium tumefaciens]|uniref:helix-turn-helix domain-containing protein n=1 Tax=Agrobacterium tumefaciens TaxID=358 RepID=UPI001AE2C1BF|nr:helix-turn-helix domain-containing protein [Agrobacterium tumefaciens]MBP2572419.1 transcriptional regulator with XRE-family HTH domain [Agrobacterium tumefaciens]